MRCKLFSYLFIAIILLSGCAGQQTPLEPETTDRPYEYFWDRQRPIASTYEGETIKISANVFTPKARYQGQQFPAIIFINSWFMDEYEYIQQAKLFAKKGYIVLSYSCRGWGKSGGEIEMWNKSDQHDLVAVVDWLLDNTPVDEQNIAASGISYGGLGSLFAITVDERIKTVAALSPCVDAYRSMFDNDTPRRIWGGLLVGLSKGRLSDWARALYTNTMAGENIEQVQQDTYNSSAINFVDQVNRPVYISSNMGDYMFMPNYSVDYFNKLNVPHKQLDLNLGTHFSHEGTGLLGSTNNEIWKNVHDWMDYWLKGIDTGIVKEQGAVLTIQTKGTGKYENERIVYGPDELLKEDGSYQWPANSLKSRQFYLAPGEKSNKGRLSAEPNAKEQVSQLKSKRRTGVSTGTPLMTEMLEDAGMLHKEQAIYLNGTLLWESEPFNDGLKIRGNAAINFNISLPQPQGQIIVHLFDVSPMNRATFITHTFMTWWDATPDEVMKTELEFLTTAYDLKPGHSLMVIMDTRDALYGQPTKEKFRVDVHHWADEQMVLCLPCEE